MTSTTPLSRLSQPPSPVTPQHVPLTALETFLAENPGLKPFLLAGPAKERAVIESAIAWAEMCDHVYHLIRPQVCGWRTGLLGILRSRMTKRGSLRNSATPHEICGGGVVTDRQ